MRLVTIGMAALIACHVWMPAAAATGVAATPPMGWNSWDAYGTSVTEAEVKANADYMAKNLKRHGWRYIVVDIQWSEPEPQAQHPDPIALRAGPQHRPARHVDHRQLPQLLKIVG